MGKVTDIARRTRPRSKAKACNDASGERRVPTAPVPARLLPALDVLLEATRYAAQTGVDLWQFAVEIEQLTALGLQPNDLRWLVRRGWVEHQREVSLECDDGRAFRPTGDMSFATRSCFVLSTAGITQAARLSQTLDPSFALESPSAVHQVDGNGNWRFGEVRPLVSPEVPCWDSVRRQLVFQSAIIKRFRWPAANQETVLAAFEEDRWPPRIDDPLPPQPGQSTKRRLSDTIKCLNRHQSSHLLRFHGDGTGEGVLWQAVEAAASNGKGHR